MRRYTIYTENKNCEEVEGILSNYFTGYTITQGVGAWKGEKEQSLVITYFGTETNASLVEACALSIKHTNRQESVLVVCEPCEVKYLL